jgi:hypothetical protein
MSQKHNKNTSAHTKVAGIISADPITIGLDKSIHIDMSKLPAPTTVYDADLAWVEHAAGRVSLMFAKLSRNDGARLRTRLEIRYPPEDFFRAFWGNSREFHGRLRTFSEMWPRDNSRDSLRPELMPADKDHSEWVNFDAMCHAGTEASIDFFLLPAAAVARFVQGQGSSGLTLAPVVRINLGSFELLRLLDLAKPVADEVESYLPATLKLGEAPAERRTAGDALPADQRKEER